MKKKVVARIYGLVVILCLFALLSGCALNSMATQSSVGAIGCPEKDIIIEDFKTGLYAATWTAKCNGKTYYCSKAKGPAVCNEAVSTKKK